jgi:hypothetical protein
MVVTYINPPATLKEFEWNGLTCRNCGADLSNKMFTIYDDGKECYPFCYSKNKFINNKIKGEDKMGTSEDYGSMKFVDNTESMLEERRRLRKERKSRTRWAKHMPKELVSEVFSLDPEMVVFNVIPKKYIVCEIQTKGNGFAQGIAINSATEPKFDLLKGKEKALGLALGALKRKSSKYPIRKNFWDFPASWTKKQIERVLDIAKIYSYRSYYIGC